MDKLQVEDVIEEPAVDLSAYINLLTDRAKKVRKKVRLSYLVFVLMYLGFFRGLLHLLWNEALILREFSILGISVFGVGFLLVRVAMTKMYAVLYMGGRVEKKGRISELWGDQVQCSSIPKRDRQMFDLLTVHTLKAAHTETNQILECPTCELLLSAMSPNFKENHALTASFQYLEQTEAVSLTELIAQLNEAISGVETGFIDPEGAEILAHELVNLGCPLETVLKTLDTALIRIGHLFETQELYYPQVLQTALAVKNALKVVNEGFPTVSRSEKNGRVLLGVVKGDIHDIGKNIVKMFLEFNGYEIIDLGVDISPSEFVRAVDQYSPDLVGISAFINTVIPAFKETVYSLRQNGFEKPILAGGIAVNALTVRKVRQELEKLSPGEWGDIIYAHNVQEVLKEVNKIFKYKQPLELVT